MFDNLTNRFSKILQNISGRKRLTEENIKEVLYEVRKTLLEADVALPVVRDFIDNIKEKVIGYEVNKKLTPAQEFIKIVRKELVLAMGEKNQTLNLATQPPAILLLTGLQGSGKTTSIAKIGKFLYDKYRKKVLSVSTDIYRPAAFRQLEILTKQASIDFFKFSSKQKPIDIVNAALREARIKFYDVLLVDTAGYLHVNSIMVEEIKKIHNLINPIETLFVVDAMTGQDAVNVAKVFNESLPLTGIILTKVDSDTRGGVALSLRYIIGKPIKFLGIGEKLEEIEPFYPDRIASRILGMGDILSLIEDIESKIDRTHLSKITKSFHQNDNFNLIDFLEHLRQIKKLGNLAKLINKIPGIGNISHNLKSQIDDKLIIKMEAMINSMTLKERANPDIIKGSRKQRIALGCGMQVQDISRFLKQFKNMRFAMKKIEKNGIFKIMDNIKNIKSSDFLKY